VSYETPQITPESLDRIAEEYSERGRQADLAGDRILAIRATGRSAKGLVEVTVDGSAVLVDLRFSDGAPASYALLGGALKQAHDRAVAEWNRQVRAITDEVLPHDDTLRNHIQRTSDADCAAHVDPANLLDDEDDDAPRRDR
jgi:hypothetical protein